MDTRGVLIGLKELEKAETILNDTFNMVKNSLGEGHPLFSMLLTNLGIVRYQQGRYEESYKIYKQALKMQEIIYGAKHPQTLMTLHNIDLLLKKWGDLA